MITIKKIDRATSIYEWNSTLNSGVDEILELGVRKASDWGMETNQASRILISWNKHTNNYNSASVRLFAANVENQIGDYSTAIQANQIKESWVEGTDKYFSSPQVPSNGGGVSWANRLVTIPHNMGAADEATLRAAGTTQSYQYQSSAPGPIFYTGSNSGSTEIQYPSSTSYKDADKWDLTIDVTVLQGIITESGETVHGESDINGLMIMHTPTAEKGDLVTTFAGPKRFFSNDTNTIYQPRLELKYNDYTWSTSKQTIGSVQATVYYKGNSGKYDSRSTIRLRPVVRESFPTASYSTSPQADNIKTFTEARSIYSIVDVKTDEEIIGFDDTFTKVSADGEGMYFDLPLEGFPKDRIYRPIIKVYNRVAEGSIEFFDSKDHFEVV